MTVSSPSDAARIRSAYDKVGRVLLDRRTPDGHWVGRLSDSALSTATAVSALAVLNKEEYREHIQRGVDWLLAHQNSDGGWGDTDKSFSNVSTTLLVKSALLLALNESRERNEVKRPDQPAEESGHCAALRSRLSLADEYLQKTGGIAAIRKRYGNDQTFSVPILTNAALAGLVDWKEIPQLPFELAALPMAWFRFVKMNVVSYAIPALVAIGQVRFHFFQEKGRFIGNFVRRLVKKRTLRLIQEMQPESGGYLEAAPLTSFVVMSLAAMGLHDHPIVTKGVRFLLDTVREDGSWSIDTNLATWLTSLSVNALGSEAFSAEESKKLVDWILSCQHTERHPFTGASPGGWGWTNLSGAVPDADDTPAALLALALTAPLAERIAGDAANIESATLAGINWLLGLQNRDGGMPTFCRGWGMLPFDKSSTDLTAHALRAFHRARCVSKDSNNTLLTQRALWERVLQAEERMFDFLERSQRADGSWLPLWFGNQTMPDDANPFYGTAKVLLAFAESERESPAVHNGLNFLVRTQNSDGSWGNSVEETAVVVEAFTEYARAGDVSPPVTDAYHRGLHWLVEAVESDRYLQASPIGLYFAKLWYYEDLYPIIFTASALRRALLTE